MPAAYVEEFAAANGAGASQPNPTARRLASGSVSAIGPIHLMSWKPPPPPPVEAPPGDLVQHVPRVGDLVVGGAHLGPGRGGDPRRRDAATIAADLKNGLISPDSARADYGVEQESSDVGVD